MGMKAGYEDPLVPALSTNKFCPGGGSVWCFEEDLNGQLFFRCRSHYFCLESTKTPPYVNPGIHFFFTPGVSLLETGWMPGTMPCHGCQAMSLQGFRAGGSLSCGCCDKQAITELCRRKLGLTIHHSPWATG